MIRIFEIKLNIGENEDCLSKMVFNKLGGISSEINKSTLRISGKSIDVRNKKNISFVYNVDFLLNDHNLQAENIFIKKVLKKNRKLKIKSLNADTYSPKSHYTSILNHSLQVCRPNNKVTEKTADKTIDNGRPVIAGFGPAGMFAGIYLVANGFRPIIIERGKEVESRIKDVNDFWESGIFNENSNPLFGEGGAGTFSDGKLTTGKNDERIPFILNEFKSAGAPEEITYIKNPHIGTDVLRAVVKNMRKKIIDGGGEILFNTKLMDINIDNNELKSVVAKSVLTDEEIIIDTNHLILAIGHSARDTFSILKKRNLQMEQKPFSMGLRIEHNQSLIDKGQYGGEFKRTYGVDYREANLPPAEYKLSHRLENGRGVYTFCMCPGGQIITTSAEKETVCVNGMSKQKRDGLKANSALLVDVRTDDYGNDDPLSGIEFQREYEKKAFVAGGSSYSPPVETVADFLGKDSVLCGCLPEFAVDGIKEAIPVFGKKIKGFDNPDAVLKGIESGSSSPVRIKRDEECVSNIKGIYPCGEGAGYAGGITSSAIDGLKCGEKVALHITNCDVNIDNK